MIPVHVTIEDLTTGVINSPSGDPVCLALSRALPSAIDIAIGSRCAWWTDRITKERLCSILPVHVIDFRKRLSYLDRFEALKWIADQWTGKKLIRPAHFQPFSFLLPNGFPA